MSAIDTLNELSQLRDSGFGRPSPRHGLHLLYWFAHDYVTFNYGRMIPSKKPSTKAYGFHQFHNFRDDDDDQLLPKQNLPYYDVGNINAPRADELPEYVRKNYKGHLPKSNMDRIMVRVNGDYLERVYITQHVNQTCFGHTHRISQGLLMIIKDMTLERFLREMSQNQADLRAGCAQPEPSNGLLARDHPSNDSWCVIL